MNAIITTTTKTQKIHMFVMDVENTDEAFDRSTLFIAKHHVCNPCDIVSTTIVAAEGDISLVHIEALSKPKSPVVFGCKDGS